MCSSDLGADSAAEMTPYQREAIEDLAERIAALGADPPASPAGDEVTTIVEAIPEAGVQIVVRRAPRGEREG